MILLFAAICNVALDQRLFCNSYFVIGIVRDKLVGFGTVAVFFNQSRNF